MLSNHTFKWPINQLGSIFLPNKEHLALKEIFKEQKNNSTPCIRVWLIPGMSRYTDTYTNTGYRYLYKKNRYVSVSIWSNL